MGKHIKTKMDYDIINQLARELYAIEPSNEVLGKFLAMDNFEGAELRKAISDVVPFERGYQEMITEAHNETSV